MSSISAEEASSPAISAAMSPVIRSNVKVMMETVIATSRATSKRLTEKASMECPVKHVIDGAVPRKGAQAISTWR